MTESTHSTLKKWLTVEKVADALRATKGMVSLTAERITEEPAE